LDAPVKTIGAVNNPAVPLNTNLEKAMLPNENIVKDEIRDLLEY
jgi:2-oxoisovalerate dehydrogenase E1 component